MNIDVLSGAELDALAATSVMGWHLVHHKLYSAWEDKDGNHMRYGWANGATDWNPSMGEVLNPSANIVLLKALGDGVTIEIEAVKGDISVSATERVNYLVSHESTAPTLPLALVRAICKAKVKP